MRVVCASLYTNSKHQMCCNENNRYMYHWYLNCAEIKVLARLSMKIIMLVFAF